jgi:hypothetical protein
MHQKINSLLRDEFHKLVNDEVQALQLRVERKQLNPITAANHLFDLYKKKKG